MSIINTVLGIPLGYLMYFCYMLVNNYGLSIILFTLLSKIILFPLSLSVQKNSIRMVKLQPQLEDIKRRYEGDKDKIAEEQIALYDREKYSPAMGCLPTLIQIPLILGLINVIYNPLQHLLRLSADTIQVLVDQTAEVLQLDTLGLGTQLKVIEAIQDPLLGSGFSVFSSEPVGWSSIQVQIQQLNLYFLGINLSATPNLFNPDILILIPLLSGLSCLAMCLIQNRVNVLQREQGIWSKWGMSIFLVAFSTYFPFIVPAGVGLYWISGNVFSIAVMFLVNVVYKPSEYIDYASRPGKPILSSEEKAAIKRQKKENRMRERVDNKRFYAEENEGKQLVFYSAKSGFYKYFENIIAHILENSELVIHYVTSDANDAIFNKNHPQIVPYYIGEKALIPFMMKMDADIVVMTMPDLQNFHIKRSLVRKDVEYIYTFHAVCSIHMCLREKALDNYDTIFCVGPHHVEEVRKTEEIYQLPAKKVVECGYGVIENLSEYYKNLPERAASIPQILIAPSWQPDNILELCIDQLLEQLIGKKYRVIVRPHPEFVKRFPEKMKALVNRYQQRADTDFIFELDFSSSDSIYMSDILVTDWSNIAHEFSFSTLKPSIFINTPMKIMNPEYEKIGIVPKDIAWRSELGLSVDLDQLDQFKDKVQKLLEQSHQYKEKLLALREENIYNFGHSGKIGGQYIIQAAAEKKYKTDIGQS